MAVNRIKIGRSNNLSDQGIIDPLCILNSIQECKFSDSLFKEQLFRMLRSRGESQTFIESLLQVADVARKFPSTQFSDSIDDERQHIIRNTHIHIVQLLVNAAGDFYNDDNKTVLHYASMYGWLGIVQSLLKEGADPNAQDIEGKTPILEAADAQHRGNVDLLVDSGADVLCCTSKNYTLLHAAAGTGWLDFVQFLLKKGANPNLPDSGGCTPLYTAVLLSQRDIVALLIDYGADTACCTYQGFPVLHCAVIMNNLEVVKCLVEKGADVNDQRLMGLSPLCLACHRINKIDQQKIEIIEYLVNAVNLKNGSNEMPLKYIMRQHPKLKLIKAFVKRYGYLNKFIDDYYEKDDNLSLKSDIFQNVQVCSQAIINKFNNKDLPALYNLSLPAGTIPPLQNLMIKSPGIIQDIERSVRDEITTSEHCDLRRPKVIVLRMLAVKSYTNCYNSQLREKAFQLREKAFQQKRSATADSGEPSRSRRKVQHLD